MLALSAGALVIHSLLQASSGLLARLGMDVEMTQRIWLAGRRKLCGKEWGKVMAGLKEPWQVYI